MLILYLLHVKNSSGSKGMKRDPAIKKKVKRLCFESLSAFEKESLVFYGCSLSG